MVFKATLAFYLTIKNSDPQYTRDLVAIILALGSYRAASHK